MPAARFFPTRPSSLIRLLAETEKLVELDRFNLPGAACTLPRGVEPQGATFFLVLNLDCRSCRRALEELASMHPDAAHVALCFGRSPVPEIPGWDYLRPEDLGDFFLLDAAPFWFFVDADGTVQSTYSNVPEPEFALPQSI